RAESASVDEPSAVGEPMPAPRLRRRRRRLGIPFGDDQVVTPAEASSMVETSVSAADTGAPEPPGQPERLTIPGPGEPPVSGPVPLRRRRLRPATGQDAILAQQPPTASPPAADVVPVEPSTPVRPRRIRRTAAAAPPTVVEGPPPPAAPVKRGRRTVQTPPT